eukprot:4486149-Pleurochrysis_carterae.AAC.1
MFAGVVLCGILLANSDREYLVFWATLSTAAFPALVPSRVQLCLTFPKVSEDRTRYSMCMHKRKHTHPRAKVHADLCMRLTCAWSAELVEGSECADAPMQRATAPLLCCSRAEGARSSNVCARFSRFRTKEDRRDER